MARQSDLYIAYSPTWKKQTNIATARSLSDLTKVRPARPLRNEHVRTEKNVRDVFDCSGQFLRKRKVLNQLGRLNIEVDAVPDDLTGAFAAALGVTTAPTGSGPFTHAIAMLGKTAYQLPFFTFLVGFADGTDDGMIFQSAVLNRLLISGAGLDDLTVREEWVGYAPVANPDPFTWPACNDTDPLNIYDGALSIAGEDRFSGADSNHTTRSFEFEINNNIITDDDAFPTAVLNPKRLERAPQRTFALRWKVEGEEGDTVHGQMTAGAGTDVPFSLRVGATTNGVTVTCPHSLLTIDGNAEQTFEGSANRAALNAVLLPLMNAGVLPFSVTAVIAGGTQLLLSA